MKYINIFFLLLTVVLISCESMEDTYSDFSGAKIRYVGKCKNPTIEAGWKRFKLSWENSVDPTIDKIKIIWKYDEMTDSVIIDGNRTSYVTDTIFGNKNYEFQLYALDKDNNQSLKTNIFGKPFTKDHELLYAYRSFEKRHYFVNNSLLLFLTSYDQYIIDSKLTYSEGGSKKTMELTPTEYNNKYLTIDNVDLDNEITMEGTVKIPECFDTIHIEPYTFAKEKPVLHSDFIDQLEYIYNVPEIDDEFISNLDTLYVDYDLITLEDLLYFPNLKHVVIGADRYMNPADLYSSSTLTETDNSIYALTELHRLKGVTVDLYNYHYQLAWPLRDFAVSKGNPVLPQITYLNMSNWAVTVSTDIPEYFSNPQHILDNDANTIWQPAPITGTMRTHELVIDMKTTHELSGFKITQPLSSSVNKTFFADRIGIYVSTDSVVWNNVLVQLYRPIGTGLGETTLITLPEKKTARYVKAVVNDVLGENKYTYLADFIPY